MLARGIAIGFLAAEVGIAAAQAPPPVFDATASLILVDVTVTDENHRPVLDLTAADFEVFEDGSRRDVVSFAAFGSAATKALAAARTASEAEQPEPAPRFVLASSVLVVDDGHLSPKEAARLGPGLTQVLRGLAERRGTLLLLAPRSGVAAAGRLPEDAQALAQAAGRVRGHRFPMISRWPMTDTEAIEIEDDRSPLTFQRVLTRFQELNYGLEREMAELVRQRARELAAEAHDRRAVTFGAVRTGFEWLARQPGRHSVLLVSGGFARAQDADFDRLVTESLRVNAPVHFLDVAAVQAFPSFETIEYRQALSADARASPFEPGDAAAGSELVASSTGGLRVSGDLAEGLARVLDTTKTYYVLGYEPPRAKKPGFRRIRVAVKAKGLTVLARRGYFDDRRPERPGENAAGKRER